MKVLFNASVVLSGLRSTTGASGTLLAYVRNGRVKGVISELILDEIVRNSAKVNLSPEKAQREVIGVFKSNILAAPDASWAKKFSNKIIDPGDAHLLATCKQNDCGILVSLDKKHVLPLRGKVKGINIVSPGELIKFFLK